MRPFRLKILSMALVLVVVVGLYLFGCVSGSGISEAAPATSGEKYEFIVSHGGTETSVNHVYAMRANELMSTKSNGRLSLKIYANSSIAKNREAIEGVIAGNIDFTCSATAGFVEFVPACALLDLPNAISDLQIMRKTLAQMTDVLRPYFEESNLKFFGFSDAGFRQVTSNRPIRTMDDFKGLKIRTMENKNHIMYWSALGANPTPMDWSELFMSLQQGIVDAQENPLDNPVDARFYEVQDYVIYTNHILYAQIMPMNLEKFNSLPPDLQQILEESLIQANIDTNVYSDNKMQRNEEILVQGGMEVIHLSDDVMAQMKEAAQGTYDAIRRQIGDELVDAFFNAANKAMAE